MEVVAIFLYAQPENRLVGMQMYDYIQACLKQMLLKLCFIISTQRL